MKMLLILFLFSFAGLAQLGTDTSEGRFDNLTSNQTDAVTLKTPLEVEHRLTPANPAAGFNRIYTKADDFLYILNSLGTENKIITDTIFDDDLTFNGDVAVNGVFNANNTANFGAINATNLGVSSQFRVNGSIPSRPCPHATQAEIDAFATPTDGDCFYNTDTKKTNVYNGSFAAWSVIGGGAGGSRLNLMSNSSFEDGAKGLCFGCSFASSTAFLDSPENKKSLEITGNNNGDYWVISTNHSATYAGKEAVIGVWVKTANAIQIAPTVDGSTLDLIDVPPSSSPQLVEMKATMGSSSLGFIVYVDSTEIAYIDEIYYGIRPFGHSDGILKYFSSGINFIADGSFENKKYMPTALGSAGAYINYVENEGLYNEYDNLRYFRATYTGLSAADLYIRDSISRTQMAAKNGLFSIWIKTTAENLELCLRVDDSDYSETCDENLKQNINNNGKWNKYEIPFVFGASTVEYEIFNESFTGDATIEIDKVYVGTYPDGYIQSINDVDTDLVTGTCTSSWDSVATTTCKFKRDGDTMSGEISVTLTGTPSGLGTLKVTLPDGYLVDANKLVIGGISDEGRYGQTTALDSGVNRWVAFTKIKSTAELEATVITDTGSTYPAANSVINETIPFTAGSEDRYVFVFSDIPIQGWSTGRTNVAEQRVLSPDKAGFLIFSFFDGDVEGHLPADGRCVLKSTYPDYVANVGTTYGECTISTTNDGVNLPNLEQDGGLFVRAATAGNPVGTVQGDMFASHTHGLTTYRTSPAAGSNNPAGIYTTQEGPAYSTAAAGGSETRPVNIAVHALVRMVDRNKLVGYFNETQINKNEDKFVTTETKWGKWNGNQLYRRCFEVASDITASGSVITNWGAGLNPKNIISRDSDYWDIFYSTNNADASVVTVVYNRTDGDVEVYMDITATNFDGLLAGTSFCMEYTK